jgi:hypothetical protein
MAAAPRSTRPTEVEPSSAIPTADPGVADDQADPGPGDLRRAEVEVSPDQPVLIVATRVEQALLPRAFPIEEDVDAPPAHLSSARPTCLARLCGELPDLPLLVCTARTTLGRRP